MAATADPTSGLRTIAPRTSPTSQPGGAGPQPEVGLLAVGEVALVEQADLFEARGPGHAAACRADGPRAPSLRPPRRGRGCRRSRGRPPVSPRRRSRRTPSPARGRASSTSSMRARQPTAGQRVVRCEGDPLPVPGPVEPMAEAGVRGGAEAAVGAEVDHLDVLGQPSPQLRPRPVVDHRDRHGHVLLAEAGDGGRAPLGPVPVDDHDRDNQDGTDGVVIGRPSERQRAGRRWGPGAQPRETRSRPAPPRSRAGRLRRDGGAGVDPAGVQLGVGPVPRHQLGVGAALDEAAAVEHEDEVGVLGRRQPVGDRDRRAAAAQALERPREAGLGGRGRPPSVASSSSRHVGLAT